MLSRYQDRSKEELIQLLESRELREEKRLGLVWERGDAVEKERAINEDFVTLDLDVLLSEGEGPYENLIIEGDNFDALRYLRMTHAGRVKCIYIDPPYNTGNRDFVYNDHYVNKEDLWRHSTWLEFMFQRLTLAKELLAADGVIFVSIDDHEMAHLKLLMDQVFPGRFVANLIWKRRVSSAMAENNISTDHEYVLCYHGGNLKNFAGQLKDYSKYKNPDQDFRGPWIPGDLTVGMNASMRPNQAYDLIDPKTGNVYPYNPNRVWAYIPESMARLIAEERIIFPKDASKRPMLKRFKNELKSEKNPFSSLMLESVGLNTEATRNIQEIFQSNLFSYSKPLSLIHTLLDQIATDKDSIVVDFFAGSGTTGHAVLKMNAADGGRRRFILVSSTEATEGEPGKNLCRDVCAERVRRVMRGYGVGEKAVEGTGGNFGYMRTRRVARREMLELDGASIWASLLGMHGFPLVPLEDGVAWQGYAEDGVGIFYLVEDVPGDVDGVVAAVEEMVRREGLGTLVVYSMQPGFWRHYLFWPAVELVNVLDLLERKFGVRDV